MGLDQRVGHLVQEMAAHIGDVIVVPGQVRGGLAAVGRSFLRAGQLLRAVTLLPYPRDKRFGRIGDPGDFAAIGGSRDQNADSPRLTPTHPPPSSG